MRVWVLFDFLAFRVGAYSGRALMQENMVLEKFQRVLIKHYTFAIFSYFKIITKELVADVIAMIPRNCHKCV